MGGVPSVPTDPNQTLQVIGAGYSRTGTVSLQLALEKLLDGPVLHGGTQILGREDACTKQWVQAYTAKRAGDEARTQSLIRALTAGFVGCADMPPIDFLPELLVLYPEAKVVLTTRDPERWLASIRPVAGNASLWWLPYAMWPVPGWRWFPTLSREFGRSTREILADGDMAVNPKPSTRLLLNWNERVMKLVPPERLLVMDLKEGWEPLCKFLDLPVPEEPFPRANDALAAGDAARDISERLLQIWVGIFSASGIVAYGAWRLWATSRR